MNLKTKEKLYLKAKEEYYNGKPIMTDPEFDSLEDELKILNSDVVKIVGAPDRNAKFPHITPMLSLTKYQTDKNTGAPPTVDAIQWMKKKAIKSGYEYFEYSPKFDGNAANAIYKDGKLKQILSRGNKTHGRDYTSKLKMHVPKTIPIKDGFVEVRGEVNISRDDFKKNYLKYSRNERNCVAGILNKIKASKAEINDLVFVGLEIKKTKNNYSEYIPVKKLKEWGFNKKYELPFYYYHYTEFEKAFNSMKKYRETKSPFLLDGFVIKVSEKYRNIFGENEHHPEWAVAIKFQPKDTSTIVKDIKWNFGKTGNYVPIAILEPIDLDGATVTKASLYNYKYIIENKVYPGAEVVIVKSGDIIPQVVKVIKPGTGQYKFPNKCTYCNSTLSIVNETHLSCVNDNCIGIKKKYFQQAINQLGLFGIGSSMIEALWESGYRIGTDLLNPEKFNKKEIVSKGIIKEGKKLDNLFFEIEKINEIELSKIILMLGFKGMGNTTSEVIANKIAGNEYSTLGLEKKIISGFEKGDTKRKFVEKTINELSKYIVIKYPKSKKNIKYIELTGSPKSAGFNTKDEFLDTIRPFEFEHGKLSQAQYLITDNYNSTSGKMKSAEQKGIEIITYSDFITMLNKTKNADIEITDTVNSTKGLF